MKKSLKLAGQKIRFRNNLLLHISITWACLLAAFGLLNVESFASTSYLFCVKTNDISLILKSEKTHYRVGESITLTSYLINSSEMKFYYVGSSFSGFTGYSGLHDFELKVYDARGKEVELGRDAGDWIWKPNTSINEKLNRAYVFLGPGDLHGLNEKLPLNLNPGQYKFQVFYKELEALRWTPEEMKNLDGPVWIKPLVSNEITISISNTKLRKSNSLKKVRRL